MSERWKQIPGCDGRYKVSSMGRVKSLVRKSPRIMRQHLNIKGYKELEILGKTRKVHRLVLTAFRGPAPKDKEAGHLNGISSDNRLKNLRWVSKVENQAHMVGHGTTLFGERNVKAKLTAKDVLAIRAAHASGKSTRTLAKKYGINKSHVSNITRRHSWRHIPVADSERKKKVKTK